MKVTCIKDLGDFEALKVDWETVYSGDPNAQIFLSWGWLRGWFEVTPSEWVVLTARPDGASSYVAFLPLSMRTARRGIRKRERQLHMGGKPLADYTGFLCLPDHEEPAIAALAAYVQQQLEWDRYHLKDVLDPRLDPFLQHIPSHAFTIRELGGTVCPYVELPGDWEEYLQRCLTAKKRQQIRRYLRGIERNKEMRITHTSAPDRDQCVEVLLGFWQQRWGNRPEHVLDMYRAVFRHCFAENHLLLPVLWDGGRAVAATAVLVDRGKKVLSGYMGGYDPGYAKISPGTTLIAYVLRYAIENGFEMFDFLRGGENYKAWFGTEERGVRHMILARRNSSRLWTGLMRQLRGKLQTLRSRS